MRCREVMVREVSISCVFENVVGGGVWVFTGVCCRGSSEERRVV